ncbi:MAG: rhomboid family intramembrane serine protease [Sedimentisphaeraceae bacterium JB056]
MGLYDRDYTKYNYRPSYNQRSSMMPGLTPAVKILLIINVAFFIFDNISGNMLTQLFALANGGGYVWQIWRLVGYQFLHASIMHILLNMLGLYFLGNTLERHWGTKKFTIFYLSCGVAGGLFFFLFTALKFIGPAILVGASGSVLGLLAACAILFPHFVVFLYFFPIPIRTAAIILPIIYLMTILTGGPNSGGEAAHLGGMAAGAIYLLWPKYKNRLGFNGRGPVDFTSHFKQTHSGSHKVDTMEVDRILKKVHEHGLHSLTEAEKKTLRRATEAEQKRDGY